MTTRVGVAILGAALMLPLPVAGCIRTAPTPWGAYTRDQPELPPGGPAPDRKLYTVLRVYDGDTLQVMVNGRREQIRLQGVNSPEESGPYREEECFGTQASAFAHRLLDGRSVMLAADPTQDDQDRFGRKLRYLWLDDGGFYNLALVREGYAYEYTYDRQDPYQYQAAFRDAEDAARAAQKGLWSPDTCAGRREAPTVTGP